MHKNHFLFQEGVWEGTGKVSFTQSPEVLDFTTTWTISSPKEDGSIQAEQKVAVKNGEDMVNKLLLTPVGTGEFSVHFENETIGTYQGKGIADEEFVGWEFNVPQVFEGLEVYERTRDGYFFHGRYNSQGGFGTLIKGSIAKRRPKSKKTKKTDG